MAAQKFGIVVWLTGLSGAGKTTISEILKSRWPRPVRILDGDEMRKTVCAGLGFSHKDRDESVRRIGALAAAIMEAGDDVIVAVISPYRLTRQKVRESCIDPSRFVEVFVDCPMDVLLKRDVKGLYAKAISGELRAFTGISDPYQRPFCPDIRVQTSKAGPEMTAGLILTWLRQRGLLESNTQDGV